MSVGKTALLEGDFKARRMWANVQCSFLHKKQEDSSDNYHHKTLLGEGRTLCVATRQKESKLGGIASIDLQDNIPTRFMNIEVEAYMLIK